MIRQDRDCIPVAGESPRPARIAKAERFYKSVKKPEQFGGWIEKAEQFSKSVRKPEQFGNGL